MTCERKYEIQNAVSGLMNYVSVGGFVISLWFFSLKTYKGENINRLTIKTQL